MPDQDASAAAERDTKKKKKKSENARPRLKEWNSPHLPVGYDHMHELEDPSSSNRAFIEIPESGWYALGFFLTTCTAVSQDQEDKREMAEVAQEERESTSDEERNKRREAKAGIFPNNRSDAGDNGGLGDVNLCIINDTSPQETKPEASTDKELGTTRVQLEMLMDGSTQRLANGVGQLYFLPASSKVSVVAGTAGQESNNHPKVSVTDHVLQWCLVYRQWISDSIALQVDPSQQPPNNHQPPHPAGATCPASVKKHIVCATCAKRFGSVRQAINHRRQKHAAHGDSTTTTKKKQTRPEQRPRTSVDLQQPLKIIYQDTYMAVIDKPQGLAVMGDSGGHSLVRSNLLMPLSSVKSPWAAKKKKNKTEPKTDDTAPQHQFLTKPVPVHRLDAATGGLLVIAKSKESERTLKACLANRKCQKKYRAILRGKLEPLQGTVAEPLSNQEALTRYRVVEHHPTMFGDGDDAWITVVDLYPETGRKHQLRKHCKFLGHSILGDHRYGGMIHGGGGSRDASSNQVGETRDAKEDRTESLGPSEGTPSLNDSDWDEARPLAHLLSRLCLWAVELTIAHPVTNEEMHFVLEEPKWQNEVIQKSAPK